MNLTLCSWALLYLDTVSVFEQVKEKQRILTPVKQQGN